ncbi:MAG: ATP-binding cassette subfamily B protein [Rickettsiales bacterium]|jgi:ATP-binding cassette subfamily B protein
MHNKPKLPKERINHLQKLLPYLRAYRLEIFFIIVTLITTSALILFLGKIVKHLIDQGFSANNANYLNFILIGLVVTIVVLAIAGYFRSFLVNSVGEKIITDLRKDIYAHIVRVSPEFFEIAKTGDVISRLTVDASVLYTIISNSMAFALRNLILFIGSIVFLFLTSPQLTLVSLALIPVAIAPILVLGRKIKHLSNKSQQAIALVGAHIEESINGIRTIQSYLCEDKEIRNFNNYLEKALSFSLEKIRIRSLMVAMVIACAFGSIVIVLWLGGHLVLDGILTSGDLSSFIFYSILSATSMVALSQIMGQLQTASSATARLFELLKIESPVIENPAPEKFTLQTDNHIVFKNVFFSYPSRPDHDALQNFNLEILPQDKIALVGESGGGKSTILKILMRFYDVTKGEILINNQNIKNISLADLRSLFSYISQDCFIFSGTIYENIAYVDQRLTVADIEKIIDENEALHFIKELPDGVHSFVGEKGVKLSGGERQRIAIARAIVKNSPILLLDEATSALDNENESLVASSLKKIAHNKTVINIAHKSSSIANSNHIAFIKNGQMIESGSHQELLDLGGSYNKMYST